MSADPAADAVHHDTDPGCGGKALRPGGIAVVHSDIGIVVAHLCGLRRTTGGSHDENTLTMQALDEQRKVTDLEDDLTDLGVALVWDEEYVTHFALVRQIQADIDHIPPAAIDAWRDAGPLRVRRHLADRLEKLDGLNLDDPMLAAFHLMALIGRDTSGGGRSTEGHVRAGVRVFLHGYCD